jgi:hypothetical protein
MSQSRPSRGSRKARTDFIEWARKLERMLRSYDARKAEVDKALADGAVTAEADALMKDLDEDDDRLVKEVKAWNGADAKKAEANAVQGHVFIHKVDFPSLLAIAEPLLARARLLADWVQDGPLLDMTGGEMMANVALEWVVLEVALTAQGIGRGNASWSGANDANNLFEAAHCLLDLVRAVRSDADWFLYLPIPGDELLDLSPDARMGMSPAAFAKRLGVAVELLRRLEPPPPPKGKPGRRGYPVEALAYAQELRAKHPHLKTEAIRAKCLKRFSEDDLPADAHAFRTWLSRNRRRTNRTD